MTPPLPIDFQPYLAAILTSDDYQDWQACYTPTTVEDRRLVVKPQPGRSPVGRFPSRLKLRAETIKPEPEAGDPSQPKDEEREKVEQWDVLAGLRHYAADHVVLIGKPGSGKSTSLERLLWEEAERAQQDSSARIPVLVKLRRCTDSLEALIRDFLQQHRVALDLAQVEDCLRQGRFLLLLDGLNELPETFRPAAANFRDRYRATTPMIVSTRDLAVGSVLGIQKTLKMLPLTEPQMREFVRGYLGTEGDRLFQQLQGDRLRKFAETPLLLWMLCRVFAESGQVPSNLGLAFREFAQLHDQDLQADVPTDSRDQWPKLLRHLAFEMMQGKTPTELRLSISQEAAEDCLTTYLQKAGWADPRGCAVRWLQDLVKYHLIQPVIQPNFEQHLEFRHQLIQEYYAAEYLLRCLPQLDNEVLKQDYLNYLKWTEPVALMLALVEEEAQALRVVRLAMDEVDLMLGARLAGEVKPEFQATAVSWIDQKELPMLLKWECLVASKSEAAMMVFLPLLVDPRCDARLRWLSVYQLGRLGNEKCIVHIVSALKDSSSKIREMAAFSLGNIRGQEAVEELLKALTGSDDEVRDTVIRSLGKVGGKAASEGLCRYLENLFLLGQKVDDEIYSIIMESLGEIGDENSLNYLKTALHNPIAEIRKCAAWNLGKFRHKEAVEDLLITLQDTDNNVRSMVICALGNIGSEQCLSYLQNALQDPSENVRSSAAEVLGNFGSKQSINSLLLAFNELVKNYITSVNKNELWSIVEALSKLGGQGTMTALVNALEHSNNQIRESVAFSLYRFDHPHVIDSLLKALGDRDYSVRNKAKLSLIKIGGSDTVDRTISILENSNGNIRESAIYILSSIGGDKVLEALSKKINDPDIDVRCAIIAALGRVGQRSSYNDLAQGLEDSDVRVRNSSTLALAKIGCEKSIEKLVADIDNPNFYEIIPVLEILEMAKGEKAIQGLIRLFDGSDDDSVRHAILKTVEKIGGDVSAQWLLKNLNHPSENVRSKAAKSIGIIGESHLLSNLWSLYRQTSDLELLENSILPIQSRCQFYNDELWQAARSTPAQSKEHGGGNTYIITGSSTIIEGNMNVYGDHVETKTAFEYFFTGETTKQKIAKIKLLIKKLMRKND